MLVIKSIALTLLLSLLFGFGFNPAAPRGPALAQPLSPPPAALSQLGEAALFSFAGQRPTNLGVKQGQLLACPSTPNCVNSQSTDPKSQIAPLSYSDSPAEAIARLKAIVAAQPRTQIVTEAENYLYAEFTSAIMGFVDDVEFYLDDAANVIHVRSASRLGQSDLGVNRKRVETIRSQFTSAAS